MRDENRRKSDKLSVKLMGYWPVLLSLITIITFSFKQTVAITENITNLKKLQTEHDMIVMPTLNKYETRWAVIDERTLEILRRLDKIDLQTRRY